MALGFTIEENGERVPHDYGSDQERAWCECQQLLEAKFYKEAHDKLDEYHDMNGRCILKDDWLLILKDQVRYLNVKPTKPEFDYAKQAWSKALWYSVGLDDAEIMDKAFEMIDLFAAKHKIPLSNDDYYDYSKADAKGTAKILDFMLSFIEMAQDQGYEYLGESDFLDIFSMGIRNLREKGDIKMARKYFNAVKKLEYYRDYFVGRTIPSTMTISRIWSYSLSAVRRIRSGMTLYNVVLGHFIKLAGL